MKRATRLLVLQTVLSLSSGLIGALVGAYITSIPASSQLEVLRQQVQIMEQGLERKPNLVMTVIPSCRWVVGGIGPNGSADAKNFTLSLSRTQNFTFTIFVSNVGDAFAHILYYAVFFDCDSPLNYSETIIPFTTTVTLKPLESTQFEYSFQPSELPMEVLNSTRHFGLTFIVGSPEQAIREAAVAEFED